MKTANIISVYRQFIKSFLVLGSYAVLKPKSLGGLCEKILDHHIQKEGIHLPRVTCEEFLSQNFPSMAKVDIHNTFAIAPGTRGITLEEAAVVGILTQASQAKYCLEFGTYRGWTSSFLASMIPEGGQIYTLDLPEGQPAALEVKQRDEYGLKSMQIGEVFRNNPSYSRKITQLTGDSASFDFSSIGVSFDLVFIDGAHSAAYIQSDTENAFCVVHAGSLIVWHDYKSSCPEVVHYLDRLAERRKLWHILDTSLVICRVE